MKDNKIQIAILGLGTVGTGVYTAKAGSRSRSQPCAGEKSGTCGFQSG